MQCQRCRLDVSKTAAVVSAHGHKILGFPSSIRIMPSGPSDRQPRGIVDRLRSGDRVLLCPLSHPVSVNEVHSALLGIAWGFSSALVLALGFRGVANLSHLLVTLWVIFGGQRTGSGDLDAAAEWTPSFRLPIGAWTITHEPWWFLIPMWIAFIVVTGGF